jgi:HEAT repeat protein
LAIAPAKEKTSEESFADGRDEQHEAQVAARIAELGNLSTKTDRASRETLLSEVKNPDHEIRQAALDAISQSGNRAAIPGLREAAAQTEDSREKKAIEEVIEFINLPTLTELLSRRGATNNQRPAQEQP